MSFRFGFGEPDVDDAVPDEPPAETSAGDAAAWLVPLPPGAGGDAGLPDTFAVVEFAGAAVHLRKCAAAAPPATLAPQASDLVPGRYEGGFKLWEGAGDLIGYLHRAMRADLVGASVLELGAGHALPALYAVQAGAAAVDVADFNEIVLREVTAANIRLNCDRAAAAAIRMVAGDWRGVPAALGGAQYDVVLASEVVYSPETLDRLARCVLAVLKPGGVALVAGKSYYFGVGGGMRAFEKAAAAAAAQMGVAVEMDVAEEIRDGKSNVREVLRVRRGVSEPAPPP
jgi:SAM-dependent methyltransferase